VFVSTPTFYGQEALLIDRQKSSGEISGLERATDSLLRDGLKNHAGDPRRVWPTIRQVNAERHQVAKSQLRSRSCEVA